MTTLFISHSSSDHDNAEHLHSWLVTNGFSDVFIDHESILGGEKWTEALKASAGACRVVACLVTSNWLASSECYGEFKAAWYMGKRILPLLMVEAPVLAGEALVRFNAVTSEYVRLHSL